MFDQAESTKEVSMRGFTSDMSILIVLKYEAQNFGLGGSSWMRTLIAIRDLPEVSVCVEKSS